MDNFDKPLFKGLLTALTFSLANDHTLGADQNKMLLMCVLAVLTLVFTPEQLINTVKEVSGEISPIINNIFDDPSFAKNLLESIQAKPNKNETQLTASPLTHREQQVLTLMANGLMNKEIAEKIGLREGTVKCHVNSILHKLNANVRTEAVVIAIKNGLIDIHAT